MAFVPRDINSISQYKEIQISAHFYELIWRIPMSNASYAVRVYTADNLQLLSILNTAMYVSYVCELCKCQVTEAETEDGRWTAYVNNVYCIAYITWLRGRTGRGRTKEGLELVNNSSDRGVIAS